MGRVVPLVRGGGPGPFVGLGTAWRRLRVPRVVDTEADTDIDFTGPGLYGEGFDLVDRLSSLLTFVWVRNLGRKPFPFDTQV